jgi:hypothetical protein
MARVAVIIMMMTSVGPSQVLHGKHGHSASRYSDMMMIIIFFLLMTTHSAPSHPCSRSGPSY